MVAAVVLGGAGVDFLLDELHAAAQTTMHTIAIRFNPAATRLTVGLDSVVSLQWVCAAGEPAGTLVR